jgi:hypothetical protein
MVIEVKNITAENIAMLLKKTSKPRKKSLAAHFGKLKRGLDGMEYQKMMRNDQWS